MASPSPTINGIPVNFGFTGAMTADGSQGISISGVSGVFLQSAEQSKVAEQEKVRDGNGNSVMHAWSDIHDEATLEWIVSGASLAAAKSNTALLNPGSFVNITACASMTALVNTTWEVQSGAKISKSNTTAAKISLPIHLLPGITGPAS